MTRADTPLLFDGYRARVDELLDANTGMRVLERVIDAYALEGEEKDALWLWAIGRRERLIGNGSDSAIARLGEPDRRRHPAILDAGHD